MNALMDHVVVVLQVLGLAAMAYGMVLTMMRKEQAMPAEAAKVFARY